MGIFFIFIRPVFAQQIENQEETEKLVRAVQNPVASLVSVPFQDNINPDIGPFGRVQNVLNIQPVIPVTINKDWNLITSGLSQ